MTPEAKFQQVLTNILNPSGGGNQKAVLSVIDRLLLTYREPGRKWHNAAYLWLGIREYTRLIKAPPTRDILTAWAYHCFELGDEDASAVAMLHDCRNLGFTLEEADRYITPLIAKCRTDLQSSSVVGDMRIAVLGEGRIRYLAYARKIRQEFPFFTQEMWRLGRTAGLKTMMARTPLYYRPEFENSLAITARSNMEAELGLLGYVPPRQEPVPPPLPEAPTLVLPRPRQFIMLGPIIAATEERNHDGIPPQRPNDSDAGPEGSNPRPLPDKDTD